MRFSTTIRVVPSALQLSRPFSRLLLSTMSPTVGPETARRPPLLKQRSSISSIPSQYDDELEIVRTEGVRHVNMRLTARHYRKPEFAATLLEMLKTLQVKSWRHVEELKPEDILIEKVSGSLTNAVFFVSAPSARTVLLRVYGPSSGLLISRPTELRILHILSSEYRIGPRIYGTFVNGRIEEFFDSRPLTKEEMRDSEVSSWIGARMAELHCVDFRKFHLLDDGDDVAVGRNVQNWLPEARRILKTAPVTVQALFDLDAFSSLWNLYWRWLGHWEQRHGASRRVFAHNDAQYGNLLRLNTSLQAGLPAHRQVIVVDFEYAAPNPAAFDIANHFHEWTADYHGNEPHLLKDAHYPTSSERAHFYNAYLDAADDTTTAEELEALVVAWSPASHGMWAIWGLVQAAEGIETGEEDFNYIAYAVCRFDAFRRGVAALIPN